MSSFGLSEENMELAPIYGAVTQLWEKNNSPYFSYLIQNFHFPNSFENFLKILRKLILLCTWNSGKMNTCDVRKANFFKVRTPKIGLTTRSLVQFVLTL